MNILKKLYLNVTLTLRRKWIAKVLYRDLVITQAFPKIPASNRFFYGEQLTSLISEPDYFYPDIPHQIEEKFGTHSPIRKYCNIFDNCLILGGDFPVVINPNEQILWNAFCYQFFDCEKYYTPARWLIQKSKHEAINIEYAIFIHSTWSSNYFHWLVDNLARLQVFDFIDISIRDRVKIITRANLLSYQVDSLSALGFKNIEYLENKNFRVKYLLVPNFPLEQRGYDVDQILWVKNKILQKFRREGIVSDSFSSKIVILRKPSSGRAFLNQEEILDALIPLGFQGIYLEDNSFEQQVKLFRNTECVIAAHGAGLANIIFSSNPIVIEIFGGKISPCYFQLAKTLGFRYGCIVSEDTQSGSAKKQSFRVNPSVILKAIQSVDSLSKIQQC